MRSQRGFSLVEILISGALVALAAMAGVAYVTRGTQHASWAKDKVYARQKALSVLAELRAYVEGGEGEVHLDLVLAAQSHRLLGVVVPVVLVVQRAVGLQVDVEDGQVLV